MKKLYIIMYISFLGISSINGQDFPMHTQYMYDKASINPGFVGVKGRVSLLLMHRSQWLGVDGAPTTSNIAFEYPLEKAAFGLNMIYDNAGPLTKMTGNLQFAYNLELSYTTFLSLGVNAGVYNSEFDINKLNIRDVGEDLFVDNINQIDFNIGIGAFLYSETWYMGVSTPNLNLQKHYKDLLSQYDKRLMHLYLMSGYNIEVSRKATLQPSVMIRYIPSLPISADLSLNMRWNETLITGLAYRLDSAYSLLIGVNVSRQLHIGYAFDWDQSKLYTKDYGSHEVFLRYNISKNENSLRYQSPRFF